MELLSTTVGLAKIMGIKRKFPERFVFQVGGSEEAKCLLILLYLPIRNTTNVFRNRCRVLDTDC